MKKIAVLSLLALLCASNCKKKSENKNSDVYCVLVTNGNGTTTSYGCYQNQKDAQNKTVELNSQGLSASSQKKSSCNECK